MGLIDNLLFGGKKRKEETQKQMKALQAQNMQMVINASMQIFPSWQTIEAIDSYVTIDDVYAIISYLAETAARVEMYGDSESARLL